MEDGRPPAPQPCPVIPPTPPTPPVQPPAPSAQPIGHPVQPIASPAHTIQPFHMPQSNWSHFKPEFAGKPDDDVEVHLLRTNDWMDTYAFLEGVKDQHFCLILVGEADYGKNH